MQRYFSEGEIQELLRKLRAKARNGRLIDKIDLALGNEALQLALGLPGQAAQQQPYGDGPGKALKRHGGEVSL